MSKNKKTYNHEIENRKARHDYHILETLEAGMLLTGNEVKSIRLGQISLRESYVHVVQGEAFLEGAHISPYEFDTGKNHQSIRSIKLLLHKKEIHNIKDQLQLKRLTVVPLKLYFTRGKAKLKIGIAKGKQSFDKRESKKEKSIERDLQRRFKN
ncbi:MAG: SsrA-binding protein SmpB [Bdellovibrionales bacterium]|nr:SsrA-binding protein SmpB [Bdellovibrionales bacterium]